MKILKIFILAILSFSFSVSCASAQTNKKENVNKTNEPQNARQGKIRERKSPEVDDGASLKTLAEGSHASVATPFVFVARTPDAFALLQKLVENLSSEKIDFKRTAVVAAFAGEKNTGGYSVDIAQNAGKISVKVVAPPKDAMVTQVITSPYKVALVKVEQENSLNLDLTSNFSSQLKNYRLTSGEFEFSGGITGMQKKFAPQGTIGVLSYGEYVTMIFNLTGKAGENKRRLFETVSGVLQGEKINLGRIEAGDFIDRPHPFLLANGTFSGDKLSLLFVPGKRDYVVNDGFSGGGKLEAVKTK